MKSRRYLSGADWILNGLAHAAQQTAQTGNPFQIVLELDGSLDDESFRGAVQVYCAGNPVLNGRVRRAWNLAPYWQPRRCKEPIPVDRVDLPPNSSEQDVLNALGEHLIVPLSSPRLSFRLLQPGAEKTFLAIRFDHRLFDAQGAERFVLGFQEFLAGGNVEPFAQRSVSGKPAGLRPWKEKFISGQAVNRLRIEQSECSPFQRPCRREMEPRFCFSQITLTREETEALIVRAYKEAGYLMLTPYLAAQTLQVVHRITSSAEPELKGYVVPCSVDAGRDDELFFNHLSFVCLSSTVEKISAPDLARTLSRQFYRQVQAGLPAHFENAWKLLRIVPLPVLGALLRGPLRTFMGSFSLAHVGDGLSRLNSWMGLPVQNAFHMPLVPPLPGLGFFANTVGGRLNLCITSYSGVLSDAGHEELTAAMRKALSASPSGATFHHETHQIHENENLTNE